MVEKRKVDWIRITTPEGNPQIASPGYIKGLLGIDKLGLNVKDRLSFIHSRIDRLESRVSILEKPLKKKKIVYLFGLIKEGEAHNRQWIENRVKNLEWRETPDILAELVKEGKLITFSTRNQKMYRRPLK